jgi:hypothetical protein
MAFLVDMNRFPMRSAFPVHYDELSSKSQEVELLGDTRVTLVVSKQSRDPGFGKFRSQVRMKAENSLTDPKRSIDQPTT